MARQTVDVQAALTALDSKTEADRQSILNHADAFAALNRVAEQFAGNFYKRWDDWDDVSASVSPVNFGTISGATLWVYLTRDQTFRAISPVLVALANEGLECVGTEDFAEIHRRLFKLKWVEDRPQDGQKIQLCVFAHEHSPVCKRVEAGVEPKYELVCSDTAHAAE